MIRLFVRHLYLRIWLASLAGVAVVVIAAGWAWQISDEQRSTPLPREVTLRDDSHQISGRGTSLRTSRPGEALEFEITLEDGRKFTMELGPRYERRPSPPPWLHPQTGIFWLLGMVGMATGIGLFPIVRRLTQRLESLQRGVQRWGEGDLSARVPEDGQDEVADLAQRFNDAATRIEQLIRSHKSLLANASHELRSPLTRIRMSLELLPVGAAESSANTAAKAEIARSIVELDQLIDEILLASRLDAREADMGTVESVDLMGLAAEECAHTGAELGVADGTALDALTVRGVPRLLRRAVRNLLENARRYGGSAGVEVELSADARHALVRVMDRGPGVPEALRERIFEPFYRLPGASEREGGVGLGLALVKSIALRHGGQVHCEGREGGGACFVIALPH
ncbi:cell wall metabolism sensor histidine kinase WalK [Xenophilus sp. Marseille-Q4582]|uniref:sensor histidine kinase n=1 Tax=Xenophilus sp. Marseille-Q4582 TaxID=2866600 RepID=UPI001CE4807F|nr:ATP-binding protein [Xenophilus sp. Marseille-Q4582]